MLLESLAIGGAALAAYHHVGYPWLMGRLARRAFEQAPMVPTRGYRDDVRDRDLPSVTVVVPAYNESAVIADKVRNLAALDYPADRLRVLICCDGCEDDTASLAALAHAEPECEHLRMTVVNCFENRGKVAMLNEQIAWIDTDLVALTDASALVSADALLIAATHFGDGDVGVVTGGYRLLNSSGAGESTYWRYQSSIKASEATLAGPIGAHGAFYMFRRSLFRPLRPDTINDDFILPMTIVADGYRAAHDERILALEVEQADAGLDWRRRKRIGAGNMQQLVRLSSLLMPSRGWLAFAFASGKALRAVMPFVLVTSLVLATILAPSSPGFALLAVGQWLGYALATLPFALPGITWPRVILMVHYAAAGHLAGLIGSARFLMGRERGRWTRATVTKES